MVRMTFLAHHNIAVSRAPLVNAALPAWHVLLLSPTLLLWFFVVVAGVECACMLLAQAQIGDLGEGALDSLLTVASNQRTCPLSCLSGWGEREGFGALRCKVTCNSMQCNGDKIYTVVQARGCETVSSALRLDETRLG